MWLRVDIQQELGEAGARGAVSGHARPGPDVETMVLGIILVIGDTWDTCRHCSYFCVKMIIYLNIMCVFVTLFELTINKSDTM